MEPYEKCGEISVSLGLRANTNIVRSGGITETPCSHSAKKDAEKDSSEHAFGCDVRNLTWRWWEMSGRQSDYHRRGTPNVIDLGDLS